jgi:heterodisulfide reductase subunit A
MSENNMTRVGVYLCRCGGNIADVVDLESVAKSVESEVAVVEVQDYLCSSAGQGRIQRDIEQGRVDRVVIGSCSPKLHLETFRKMAVKAGINPHLLEITNLREQDSWVHDDEILATEKAAALIKGAVARMKLIEALEPIEKEVNRDVLVIGGGIAGITTALELADHYNVHLVERSPWIGGHMIGLSKTFPTLDCSQCILTPKMVAVHNHPNITLHTQTEVAEVEGSPGDYRVKLRHAPRYVDIEKCTSCGACAKKCPVDAIYLPFPQAIPQAYIIDMERCKRCGACVKACPRDAVKLDEEEWLEEINVGAAVIATGFEPLDVSFIEQYHPEHPNVINAVEFEEMLSAKSKTGMRLQRADGSFPNSVAFVLCTGSRDFTGKGRKHCSKVCCIYSQKLAQTIKKMSRDAEVWLFYIDMRSPGRRFEEFYYHTQEKGVQFVRGKVAEIIPESPAEGGRLAVHYENTLLGRKGVKSFDLVVLCPALVASPGTRELADAFGIAVDENGFIEEKHVKLDPVNTLNQAVFAAGCVLGPKDIHDSVTEGISAAHKTSQFLGAGILKIAPEKPVITQCNACEACVKECPYDALYIKDGYAEVDMLKCTGCGICVPACPLKGVEIRNYTREQLKAQIKGVAESGGIIAFMDTYAYAAADIAGLNRLQYTPYVRFITVPSIHIVDEELVNTAFEAGAAGVLLVEGTTDERLTTRSNDLYKKLKKATRKHKKPLRYSHIETAQYEKLTGLLNVFAEQAMAKAARKRKKEETLSEDATSQVEA